ncbi:hypothetical protein TNCT_364851 [Trichonephila clavata]|uniref:Uncharacterized protein n=1 Tax=Trichonephila clavata TaxID=2740835 RepID=A0A8X6M3R3_TRICU|nr:hypothetical protein TNCT_364851 [Trichonephila clavata]
MTGPSRPYVEPQKRQSRKYEKHQPLSHVVKTSRLLRILHSSRRPNNLTHSYECAQKEQASPLVHKNDLICEEHRNSAARSR